MVIYKLIENLDDLEGLKEDWYRLENTADTLNIFQCYDWVHAWWKHFGGDKKLRVLSAWKDDALILAAPFFMERKSRMGISVQRIGMIGDLLSTNHDFIPSGVSPSTIRGCISSLLNEVDNWDVIELKKLPENSPIIDTLRHMGEETGLRFIDLPYAKYPFLEIKGDFESFLNRYVSRNYRISLRRSQNRIRNAGDIRFVQIDEMQLEDVIEDFHALSIRGWKHEAGVDPLTGSTNWNFFNELFTRLNLGKRLFLSALEFNGQKIAYIVGFVNGKQLQTHYTAFDEQWHHLSPGKIIWAHMIERAFSLGLSEIDFSEGEEEFKLHWTKRSRPFREVYLLNRESPKYAAILSGLSIRRRVKTSSFYSKHLLKLKQLSHRRRLLVRLRSLIRNK